MIYGPPGVGKSWFVQSLAIMVAIGQMKMLEDDALQFPSEGIPILYIDGEMTKYDFQQRTKQLISALGLDTADPFIRQGLTRITSYLKTMRGGCPFIDLSDSADKDRILSEVKNKGFKLVIFDNLSTLSAGLKSENDATEWNPLNDLIIDLKGLGCAVITVHHSGKNGSYRGSSNLLATLEKVISLEAVLDSPFHGCQFTVMAGKDRNGDDLQINEKILQLAKLKDGEGVFEPWIIKTDENAKVRQFVRMLNSLNYTTQEDLGLHMDPPVSQPTVHRLELQAMASKMLTKERIKELKELAQLKYASLLAETEQLQRGDIDTLLAQVTF
jgi:RecA-family ATPase